MSRAREATIAAVRAVGRVPVLIIGAGINGAGLFRDLSLQGVDCLLVDRGDICAGASAAPSRLIHGGIKYLETGEFRLVAQSTLERNLLLRNAPHYVRPLETVVPVQSWFGGIIPSLRRFLGLTAKLRDRGLLVTALGLALYDWLGRNARSMPRHRLALRRASLRRFPAMNPNIVATGTYYDARITQPERLGLELVLDGLRENPGARALNHVAVEGCADGAVMLHDRIGGARFAVVPRIVINAGGAWIDRINASLGVESHYIGGTKGSHLVVDSPPLLRALDGRMVYFGAADGRVCLAYPFMGHVLIGSTDIRADDPDAALCEPAEQDYMLSVMREIFPAIALGARDVLYRYCGVRPLPYSTSSDPGDISRDHSIRQDTLPGGGPVLSLIGGKWTTFRGFAEEVADRVLTMLETPRRASTRTCAIGGGAGLPADEAARAAWMARVASAHGLDAARVAILLERYGSTAESVAAWCAAGPDRALASLADYSVREIGRLCQEEMAETLADLLFRRTDVALSGRLTRAVAAETAAIAAPALGWSDARAGDELNAVLTLARQHGVRLDREAA